MDVDEKQNSHLVEDYRKIDQLVSKQRSRNVDPSRTAPMSTSLRWLPQIWRIPWTSGKHHLIMKRRYYRQVQETQQRTYHPYHMWTLCRMFWRRWDSFNNSGCYFSCRTNQTKRRSDCDACTTATPIVRYGLLSIASWWQIGEDCCLSPPPSFNMFLPKR